MWTLGVVKEPYTPTHEIAYCMGLIVGEGCFSVGPAPSLIVGLHASDPEPLIELRAVFGGSLYGPYHYPDGRHKRVWVLRGWQLQEALPFFDRWLPPSRKREQYVLWRARCAEYFAILRPVTSRNTRHTFHDLQ